MTEIKRRTIEERNNINNAFDKTLRGEKLTADEKRDTKEHIKKLNVLREYQDKVEKPRM